MEIFKSYITHNADVSSVYTYDKETRKFKLSEQELNNDSDTEIYCMNCGKILAEEIAEMLEF